MVLFSLQGDLIWLYVVGTKSLKYVGYTFKKIYKSCPVIYHTTTLPINMLCQHLFSTFVAYTLSLYLQTQEILAKVKQSTDSFTYHNNNKTSKRRCNLISHLCMFDKLS